MPKRKSWRGSARVSRTARLLGAALLVAAAACGSEPEPTGPDNDVPVGLRVHLNGALVARIDGATVEGFLHVHVGEYSGQFIVSAVNGAGNTIDRPGMFNLEADVANPAIAAFVQPSAGALQGEIVASAAGETRLTLSLWRGQPGSGTAAFTAPPIEVLAIPCEAALPQSASIRASESMRATTSPSLTSCAPRTTP